MKFSTFVTSAAMALVMSAGAVMAQTPPAPTAKQPDTKMMNEKSMSDKSTPGMTMKKTKKMKMAKPAITRSANSMACSADADAKSLHGKARKTFRKSCMSGKTKMNSKM